MEPKPNKSWFRPMSQYEEAFEMGDSPILRAHYGLDEHGMWHAELVINEEDRLASLVYAREVGISLDGDVPPTDPTFIPRWMNVEPSHRIEKMIGEDAIPVSVTYDSLTQQHAFLDVVLLADTGATALRFHRPFWISLHGFADCPCCRRLDVRDISRHGWEDVEIFADAESCAEGWHFFARSVEVVYSGV